MGHARISRIYSLGQREQDHDPLATNARIERLRKEAWRQQGVVTVRPGELPQPLAEALSAWAASAWGQRSGR